MEYKHLRALHQSDPQTFQVLLDYLPESDQQNITNLILRGQDENRFVLHWADEALEERPAIPWVIKDLFKEASVSVLFGDGGSGKTWTALNMAACIASGKPWLGHHTMPATVLIFDEESGEDPTLDRLAAVRRGLFLEEPGLKVGFYALSGLNLTDESDQQELRRLILEAKAGFVILDALIDFMPNTNENAAGETQPLFQSLRRTADHTRAAILLLHHANKMGGYRGSTAIRGAIDLLLKLEKNDDWLNFEIEKARHTAPRKFYAAGTWIEDSHGDVEQFYMEKTDGPNLEKPRPASQEYVLKFLEKNGESGLPTIMAHADVCSPNAAKFAVYALVKESLVYRTNPGEQGHGVIAVYDLSE